MQEKVEELSGLDNRTRKAVSEYKRIGGVVKVREGRIVYPDKARIKFQLEQVRNRLESLKQQRAELARKKREYSYNSLVSEATRFADPLYWRHLVKMLTDKNYKEVFETVEPPVERIKDAKWRSMIKMFVKSEEYRQRLLEAKTSEIGRNRETIRESVEKNLNAAQELITHRLEKIEKEREALKKKEKALSLILSIL